jgi:hypothetical protein
MLQGGYGELYLQHWFLAMQFPLEYLSDFCAALRILGNYAAAKASRIILSPGFWSAMNC